PDDHPPSARDDGKDRSRRAVAFAIVSDRALPARVARVFGAGKRAACAHGRRAGELYHRLPRRRVRGAEGAAIERAPAVSGAIRAACYCGRKSVLDWRQHSWAPWAPYLLVLSMQVVLGSAVAAVYKVVRGTLDRTYPAALPLTTGEWVMARMRDFKIDQRVS